MKNKVKKSENQCKYICKKNLRAETENPKIKKYKKT